MSIIINGGVTINGNVTINNENEEEVSKAKDKLLNILFYKRNNSDWGGREGWIEMLDMYFFGNYEGLCDHISTFKDGKSKEKAISCLQTIIADNIFSWQRTAQN